MTEYCVPTAAGEASFTEKRSEFLGHVRPVESEEEARAFVAEMKKKYYDARHNCWCYIIKDGPERYSDDGEPQGTAGIPMLEVFRREGVCNVVCVVCSARVGFCARTPRARRTRLTLRAYPLCGAGSRRRSTARTPRPRSSSRR